MEVCHSVDLGWGLEERDAYRERAIPARSKYSLSYPSPLRGPMPCATGSSPQIVFSKKIFICSASDGQLGRFV